MTATPKDTWLGFNRWTRAIQLAGLSGVRDAHFLGARSTDRVVEQLERYTLPHLKVPELAQEIRLVEEDIPAGSADDAAALTTGQGFDSSFRELTRVDRLRSTGMRRRRHRTPFQESGLPTRKAAYCKIRKTGTERFDGGESNTLRPVRLMRSL